MKVYLGCECYADGADNIWKDAVKVFDDEVKAFVWMDDFKATDSEWREIVEMDME
jgi:hypothetical protein